VLIASIILLSPCVRIPFGFLLQRLPGWVIRQHPFLDDAGPALIKHAVEHLRRLLIRRPVPIFHNVDVGSSGTIGPHGGDARDAARLVFNRSHPPSRSVIPF
jgi:hypothetical protein